MPTTKTVTLYQYDELDDRAKERARDWYTSCNGDYYKEWVYEDAECVAAILGIDFDQRTYKTYGGGTGAESKIWYSGFWSQGDGACFEGSYTYKKGATKKIRAYCSDHELIRIADTLQIVQRKAFYGLTASMRHSGHYYHSGCMRVEVEKVTSSGNAVALSSQEEDDITQLMRDFADWIYKQLDLAYEDSISKEVVEESIRANGYTFLVTGERED